MHSQARWHKRRYAPVNMPVDVKAYSFRGTGLVGAMFTSSTLGEWGLTMTPEEAEMFAVQLNRAARDAREAEKGK